MENSLNNQVDLNKLSNYKLDSVDINYFNYIRNSLNLKDYLKYYLDAIDVSKHSHIQTIDFAYKRNIAFIKYALLEINYDITKNKYIQMILEIHKSNLEYESIHPPVTYDKKVNTKSKIKAPKTIKQTKDIKVKTRLTIVNIETNKEVTLDRDLALSVIKDKPLKFKMKDD